MARAWTIANAVMLVAFVFSVIVQFNDPDPFLWAAIYALAAIVCGLEIRRRTSAWLPAILAAGCCVWAATLAPRVIGQVPFASMFAEFEMADSGIEESREMYGLLLIALWMIAVASAAWRRRSSLRPSSEEGRAAT